MEDRINTKLDTEANRLALINAQIMQDTEEALLNRNKVRWYELALAATAAAGLISVGIGIAKLLM